VLGQDVGALLGCGSGWPAQGLTLLLCPLCALFASDDRGDKAEPAATFARSMVIFR
jgi:hypothetical protein